MEWFPAHGVKSRGHDCQEVVVAMSGENSNRRYAIGRFEAGLGWKDESNRTLRDVVFYAVIKAPPAFSPTLAEIDAL